MCLYFHSPCLSVRAHNSKNYCSIIFYMSIRVARFSSKMIQIGNQYCFNRFSTTGRCSGPPCCDTWIRHFARPTFVTSSFKIFLTQPFPPCGATCYTLPSRTMTQLFNGVDFVYHSVEVCRTFCSYLRVLVRIRNVYNGGRY